MTAVLTFARNVYFYPLRFLFRLVFPEFSLISPPSIAESPLFNPPELPNYMKGRSVNYSWSWSPFCLLSLPPNPPFMLLQTTSLDFSCGRTLRGKLSFTYLAVLILALIPKESVAVPLDWPLVQYSTIGKLRSIFNSIGRSGDWSGLSPSNPVAHPSAKKYLASISEEQAKARVTSRECESRAFFPRQAH